MTNLSNLTPASAALLVKIIKEAEYESDTGMDDALMDFSKEERGNLSDLKKKGYVETMTDADAAPYVWCLLLEPARSIYEALKN